MTSSGWIIMAASVGSVSILFIWCIYKVLSTPGKPRKCTALSKILRTPLAKQRILTKGRTSRFVLRPYR